MYFWNQKPLAQQLKNGALSEWQKTKYYLAAVLFHILVLMLNELLSGQSQFLFLVVAKYTLCVIVVIFFVSTFFERNRNYDNSFFIERLVIIGFPASIKSFVFIWCLYFAMVNFAYPFEEYAVFWMFYNVLGSVIYYIVYFMIIRSGLDEIYAKNN